MAVLQFYKKSNGIRFYNSELKRLKKSVHADTYISCSDSRRFLDILNNRLDNYDVVIIVAHGSKNSILAVQPEFKRANGLYIHDIGIESVSAFKNDFVLAVACYTAKQFGPRAIDEGALAYLGYDESIEPLYKINIKKNVSFKVKELYETEIKKVFSEEICSAFVAFVGELQTAEELRANIQFRINKRIRAIFRLTQNELVKKYGWRQAKKIRKYRPIIEMTQIEVLKKLESQLVLLGDPNYIPINIKKPPCKITEEKKKHLDSVLFENKQYESYFKRMLKDIMSDEE